MTMSCLYLAYSNFPQVVENGHDEYHSSDEECGKMVAQKKYEQFQQMCGDLLDPSNSPKTNVLLLSPVRN